MKIPFGWLPGHWGLKGNTRERARIEYEIQSPYERAIKLLDLRYIDMPDTPENNKRKQKELYNIQFANYKITESEYRTKCIELLDSPEREFEALEYLFEKDEITELEYQKELATLKKEPFFYFDIEYVDGAIELETTYNEIFISYLRKNGYTGETSEDVIDWYVRDCGRRISGDDIEDAPDTANAMTFVKSYKSESGTDYI